MKLTRTIALDVLAVVGLTSVVGGACWLSPAFGLIVGGVLATALAVVLSKLPADRK